MQTYANSFTLIRQASSASFGIFSKKILNASLPQKVKDPDFPGRFILSMFILFSSWGFRSKQ
jgi:hypothetical protein